MLGKSIVGLMFLALIAFVNTAFAAGDPTLHQVYQAVNAGRLDEAQRMMDQVLRDHPNSAKAHFVEAELLARGGRLANAKAELDTAERLAPGLPFAKPQAVQKLRDRIASPRAPAAAIPAAPGVQAGTAGGIPWGLLLMGIAVLSAIAFFVRAMGRRNAALIPAGSAPGYRPGASPYGAGGMAPPMGPTGGGMGSGIMGSLATGAALGAGMVAGEALMHRFTDGNQPGIGAAPPGSDSWGSAPDDMGGSDFGIADSSSWDDSSGGGGDDWSQ